jgi:hypothetical protein
MAPTYARALKSLPAARLRGTRHMRDRQAMDVVTDEMIEAGVKAANLISYEWGSTPEGKLVSRVYQAMRILSPENQESREHIEG